MRDSDWTILATLHRCQNITKTASQLFMTQPALTKRIRAMELEWNGELIQRSNKGITFTPLGEYLATSATDVTAVIERIHRHVSETDSGAVGTLKIGGPSSVVRFHLPRVICCYKTKYPNVDFSITTCLSDSVPKLLYNHHVQVAFLCGDYPYDGDRHLMGQTQCLLVSREPLDFSMLPQIPRIEYVKGWITLEMQDRWWNERFDTPPRIDYNVHQADASLEMIMQGLGYGFFSMDYNFSTHPGLFVQPLCYLDGTPVMRNNWMLCDPKTMQHALIRNFVDYIKREQIIFTNDIAL